MILTGTVVIITAVVIAVITGSTRGMPAALFGVRVP